MEVKINVPEYKGDSFKFNWTKKFEISFSINDENCATIKANKEGLESLANHILNLAQDSIPAGYHIHLDDYGSLVEGSAELIIEKMDNKK